jgi:hypothetical protein
MNGRIYDPQLSRFLGPDPILHPEAGMEGYNGYGYVLNNPLLFVDPSGYLFGYPDVDDDMGWASAGSGGSSYSEWIFVKELHWLETEYRDKDGNYIGTWKHNYHTRIRMIWKRRNIEVDMELRKLDYHRNLHGNDPPKKKKTTYDPFKKYFKSKHSA